MGPKVNLWTNLKKCLVGESKDRVGHDVGTVTSIFIIATLSISIGSRGIWKVFLSLLLFL